MSNQLYGRESLGLQDKKEELQVEQVQSEVKLTELETLLSTNLLKQQRELQERLSKADVSADRWRTRILAHEQCQLLEVLHDRMQFFRICAPKEPDEVPMEDQASGTLQSMEPPAGH